MAGAGKAGPGWDPGPAAAAGAAASGAGGGGLPGRARTPLDPPRHGDPPRVGAGGRPASGDDAGGRGRVAPGGGQGALPSRLGGAPALGALGGLALPLAPVCSPVEHAPSTRWTEKATRTRSCPRSTPANARSSSARSRTTSSRAKSTRGCERPRSPRRRRCSARSHSRLGRASRDRKASATQRGATAELPRTKDAATASSPTIPVNLEVLRAVSKKPLPRSATARDALLAVAALGGHIKNNGDPGWLVLGRGLHDLLLLKMGWRAPGEK